MLYSGIAFMAAGLALLVLADRNLEGNLLPASDSIFLRSTTANRIPLAGTPNPDNWIYGAMTLGTVFFLIFFVEKFSRWLKKEELETEESIISAADFAIRVTGMPAETDPEELATFFSQNWGPVKNCVIVYSSDELAKLRDDIYEGRQSYEKQIIKEKLDPRQAEPAGCCCCKRKTSEYWRNRINANEAMLPEKQENTHAVAAYVSFETSRPKEECLQDMGQEHLPSFLYFLGCCACTRPQFNGNELFVTQAPEPSDILWENSHMKANARTKRQLITLLVSVGLIIGSVYMIFFMAQRTDSSLNIALFITAVNMLMKVILQALVKLERPESISSLEFGYFQKLTFLQIANTAITVFIFGLTNAESRTTQFRKMIDSAMSIVTAELVKNNFLRFANVDIWIKRWILAPRAVTQSAMDRHYTSPAFKLYDRYVAVSNVQFASLMYMSVAPSMPFLAGMSNLIGYWIDRYNLLRIFAKPPKFDGKMALMATNFMRLSLVAHLGFAAFFYSPEMFYADISFDMVIVAAAIIGVYYVYRYSPIVKILKAILAPFKLCLKCFYYVATCQCCRNQVEDLPADFNYDDIELLEVYLPNREKATDFNTIIRAWPSEEYIHADWHRRTSTTH
eukprot:TRINITY_DN3283_c0_g1_i5.p1 TRINITY_DN3283_c0_g1~~TRINITY_DN3283_c0_g1_i5.p1  ORF type:complete len:697 (-),score=168.60 TRINITY_DN3283_c0_g1_i5:176-2041(-)